MTSLNPDGTEYSSGYYPAAKKSAARKAKKSPARKSSRPAPTAAQAAAAADRRNKMRKLAGTVAAMTPDQRAKLFAAHPIISVAGHALSIFNTCFVLSQLDSSTMVGGFNQWRAAGRSVRKGERGLAIWIPIKRAEDPNCQEGEMSSADEAKFMLGTVFDVSQTEEIAK